MNGPPNTTLDFLQKRLPPNLGRWAPQLYSAFLQFGLDAFVLAGMLQHESGGGDILTPKGPEGLGDPEKNADGKIIWYGHGLFQIDSRFHPSFLAAVRWDGKPLWKIPEFNCLYAAELLKANLDAADGNYQIAIASFNAGLSRCLKVARDLPPDADLKSALDVVTTHGDYLSTVLNFRNQFLGTPIV